jgi:predicted ribosomally synthesized peptide with SipW-like signal peptide
MTDCPDPYTGAWDCVPETPQIVTATTALSTDRTSDTAVTADPGPQPLQGPGAATLADTGAEPVAALIVGLGLIAAGTWAIWTARHVRRFTIGVGAIFVGWGTVIGAAIWACVEML